MKLTDGHGLIVFAHFQHELIRHLGGDRRATFATVHLGPCAKKERPCGTVDAVIGRAICNPTDPFIPVLGRKIALARAFKRAKLDVKQRTSLWMSYFRETGVWRKDKETGERILVKAGIPERGLLGKSRKRLNAKANP
jgi:hypothetical protein